MDFGPSSCGAVDVEVPPPAGPSPRRLFATQELSAYPGAAADALSPWHGNPLLVFSGGRDWGEGSGSGCRFSPAWALSQSQLLLMIGGEKSLCAAHPG